MTTKEVFIKWQVVNNKLLIYKVTDSPQEEFVEYDGELCSYDSSYSSPHNTEKIFTKIETNVSDKYIYVLTYQYGEERAYSTTVRSYIHINKNDLFEHIKEIYIEEHENCMFCELCGKNGDIGDEDKGIKKKCIKKFMDNIMMSKDEEFGGNYELGNLSWKCYGIYS